MTLFEQIEFNIAEMSRLPLLPVQARKKLNNEFISRFTYDSCALDGIPFKHGEVEQILRSGVTPSGGKAIKFLLDILGHIDAVKFCFKLLEEKNSVLDLDTLKKLHQTALLSDRENCGIFRNFQLKIKAEHQPPVPFEIETALSAALKGYQEKKGGMHILEALAALLAKMESIHPFAEANGRVMRLVLNLELLRAGYPTVVIRHKDRSKYASCFADFDKYGDSENLADFLGGYMILEVKRLSAIRKKFGMSEAKVVKKRVKTTVKKRMK